jgi:Tfp pilus assembly protein PilN
MANRNGSGGFLDRLSHPRWAAVALVVAAAAITGLELLKSQQIGALRSTVDTSREEASSALSLAQELEQLEETSRQIANRKAQASASETIGELARVIPPEAWLESITFGDGAIHIKGYAKSALAVLKAIESSSRFEKAVFSAPISIDTSNARERFDLKAELTQEGAS